MSATSCRRRLWQSPSEAQAQARLRDWLASALRSAAVARPAVSLLPLQAAPAASGASAKQHAPTLRVRATVNFDLAPNALENALVQIEAGGQLARIDSLSVSARSRRVEMTVSVPVLLSPEVRPMTPWPSARDRPAVLGRRGCGGLVVAPPGRCAARRQRGLGRGARVGTRKRPPRRRRTMASSVAAADPMGLTRAPAAAADGLGAAAAPGADSIVWRLAALVVRGDERYAVLTAKGQTPLRLRVGEDSARWRPHQGDPCQPHRNPEPARTPAHPLPERTMMLKPTPHSIEAPLRRRVLASLLAGLGGCAAMPPPILPLREPTAMDMASQRLDCAACGRRRQRPPPRAGAAPAAARRLQPAAAAGRTPRLFETPPPPRPGSSTALPSPAGTPMPDDPALETAVALEQLPLPVFIDTVFATILKRNVSVDPAIAQRKEFVSLKSGKAQTASQLYEAAQGGAQVLRHRRHRIQRPGARHGRRGQRRLRARGAPWPQRCPTCPPRCGRCSRSSTSRP